MIRYYCNKCEALLSATKYTVVVKLPDGTQQSAVHLCSDCYKKLLKFYANMGKPAVDANSDALREIPEDILKPNKEEQAEGTQPNTEGNSKSEDKVPEMLKPDYGNNQNVTGWKAVESSSFSQSSRNTKITVRESLPKSKPNKNTIERVRRVLIDYYREVDCKATMQRNGITYNKYYQAVTSYGSQTVKDRYDGYKRFAEKETGNSINAETVLSLYAGGFSLKDVGYEVGCDDISLIEEIIQYYTGV